MSTPTAAPAVPGHTGDSPAPPETAIAKASLRLSLDMSDVFRARRFSRHCLPRAPSKKVASTTGRTAEAPKSIRE
jgi:hypothetical protein